MENVVLQIKPARDTFNSTPVAIDFTVWEDGEINIAVGERTLTFSAKQLNMVLGVLAGMKETE